MNIRKTFSHPTLLACGRAGVGLGGRRRGGGECDESRVAVSWTNPADFSEAKKATAPASAASRRTNGSASSPNTCVTAQSACCRNRSDLEVTFTNVQRAGTYEPWRGPRFDDVRVIKDIYPPRIDLTFTLTDASGTVIKEGTRELLDQSFLQRGRLNETDPLRFEKRMLDDWLRSEFPDAGDARG